VLNNLAWLLATSPGDDARDGKRAVELATKDCEVTEWEEAHIISTLADAYAEIGDFDNARTYSKQAVEDGTGSEQVTEQLAAELESYEAAAPWRERQTMEEAGEADADAASPFDGDMPAAEKPAAGQPADDAAGDKPADPPAVKKQPVPAITPRRPFDDDGPRPLRGDRLVKIDAGDEQQVDQLPRFVGLINDHGSALGMQGRLLGVRDGRRAAVRDMQQECAGEESQPQTKPPPVTGSPIP
jgi:hypothetical protein